MIVGGKKVLESWITYVVIAVVVAGFLLYNSGIAPSKWIAVGTEYVTTFTDKFPSLKTPEGAVRNKSELVPGTWAFVIPLKDSKIVMSAVKTKTNMSLLLFHSPSLNTWLLGITALEPNPPFKWPIATIEIIGKSKSYKLGCTLTDDFSPGGLRRCTRTAGEMSVMQLEAGDLRMLAEGSTVKLTNKGSGPLGSIKDLGAMTWTFSLKGSALAIKNMVEWK